MKRPVSLTQEAAEGLAIQALTFIAGDGERLGRFLAITGIGPAQIRAAAHESGFLIGLLDYLAADERLLSAFAAETGVDPAAIGKAIAALGGHWAREIP
ncbi:MAG TPA: DUF3572 domain-containing protein [Pseudolabrys sp.]|jgi:hypothetical protein